MFIIACTGITYTEERTRKLILAGADVLRVNLCRYSTEKSIRLLQHISDIISSLNANVKILVDLPYNKIMLGDFDTKSFSVKEGEEFICKTASYSQDCKDFIPIQIEKLGTKTQINQTIIIGDGEIAAQVIEIINDETIKIKMLNNGNIRYLRTVNINDDSILKDIEKKIFNTLKTVADLDFDYISIPYVEKNINQKIKNIMPQKLGNKKRKIILRIENNNGLNDLSEILSDNFYDIIMFSRGDIGLHAPYEQVGLLQKKITSECKKIKKPIIIASNILESTLQNFIPSHSDISDLTNMVMDKIDGIQFGVETGIFGRPANTISAAKKIITATERFMAASKK